MGKEYPTLPGAGRRRPWRCGWKCSAWLTVKTNLQIQVHWEVIGTGQQKAWLMLNFELFNTNLQLQVRGEVTGAGMQLRGNDGHWEKVESGQYFLWMCLACTHCLADCIIWITINTEGDVDGTLHKTNMQVGDLLKRNSFRPHHCCKVTLRN